MKTINFAVSEHNSRVYSLIFLGDNMKFKKYATKTLMIVIGSIISAYGITLAIGAGFGGATLAILWQGLTNVTGMSIGTSSLIVAVAMIIFALFYDRKQINIGTILYQIIYSFFVDVFTKIQHYTDIKAVNFVIMLLGIAIFSFGTGIYSAADFGRGSYEAVTFSLAEKNGWKIKIVRMVLDIIMVIIGVLLGGKFQFIYSILCKPCVFKAYRLLNIQTLCIFPCFCPYEPKQGKFFMLRRLPYPVVLRKYASLPL